MIGACLNSRRGQLRRGEYPCLARSPIACLVRYRALLTGITDIL
jgi:hypothetical protein